MASTPCISYNLYDLSYTSVSKCYTDILAMKQLISDLIFIHDFRDVLSRNHWHLSWFTGQAPDAHSCTVKSNYTKRIKYKNWSFVKIGLSSR